ncbi:MAG: restriction endonuclease subunit S [Candidatus Accumulibacter sp.]|uniref:Restriction endonuclease subunit S n=1 Tax=Candidatus Accumulibacter proximus TaxID=2954385 RepID=A0A935Q108_9PROT|nr:restriction endonuclease subunit S [Candidatus Accumulibacter proximus]
MPAEALCEAVIDCKNRTPPETADGHPVIRTPNVRDGKLVWIDLAFTDAASYEVWTARGRPKAGDVVITREAPFGEARVIPEQVYAPCLGQRMMMYQTAPGKLRADYLVYAIYSHRVQKRLFELAGGSTVGHIRVGDIRTLSIPHPMEVNEQERIASALNGISNGLKDAANTHKKLCSIKQGLMEDLLTGERRVTQLLAQAETQ